MVEIPSRIRKSWVQWLAPAAALMVLAACEVPTRSAEFREQHKLLVARQTISLVVAMPADGAELAGLEAAKFELFVNRFIESGQGQMTVEASGDAAERARQLLVRQGVRGGEIVVAPGAAGARGAAVLTFTAATVAVPECEDWSSNATFNWSNLVHSNFGCATQRNIGLMVRNPADLEGPREMGGGDGEHGAGVITNYRKGPITFGPQKPKAATTSK